MSDNKDPSGPSVARGATQSQTRPGEGVVDQLPPFKVLLHKAEEHDMIYVVETICDLTPLNPHSAASAIIEARNTGAALLLTTHRERAELYIEQFKSKRLSVSIEPAE